jgi:hypothetical protein
MTPWMFEAGDSLKRLLQGAVAGALIMVIVGFAWGGWKLEALLKRLRKSEPDRQFLPLFHRPVSTSSDTRIATAATALHSSAMVSMGESPAGGQSGSLRSR